MNVDKSHVAQKLLEWERIYHQLGALTKEIENDVIELGETQTAGNIEARYYRRPWPTVRLGLKDEW